MTFRYLDDRTLAAVREAAEDIGHAADDLDELNRTKVLPSGEVPLERWLDAAIVLARGRPGEPVFRSAMQRVVPGGAGEAPPEEDEDAERGGPERGTAPSRDVEGLPTGAGGLEIDIDEDDTLDVGYLHNGSAASRSVAKVLVHRHFDGAPSYIVGNQPDYGKGTGWLIAPRLLITNNHVVNARVPLEPPASEADFALQGAAAEVQFDFHKATSTYVKMTSIGCVATDRALDFALLRLPDDVGDRAPLRLRSHPITKPKDRALMERVNVLQHPKGDPMRLGFRNNFVVTGSDARLSYLTDTAGGSSGSPICDDAWLVAGLHRGFDTIPDGVMVWGKTIYQENYATPIGQILTFLADKHADLHAEIMAGQAALPPEA